MMKKPYVIVLGDGFPRKQLLDEMDRDSRFGVWFYSMPNSFIVYSSIDANAIDKVIKEKIGDKFRYFISEVSKDNRQGWMPSQHWDLINHQGADKVFDLNFQGYYTDATKIPAYSAVFCVYNCTHNPKENLVSIGDLLYIGYSSRVNAAIMDSELQNELKADCVNQQILCYSVAPVDALDADWCLKALCHVSDCKHKSKTDSAYVYDDAFVITRGQNARLTTGALAEKEIDARG